MSKMFPKLTPTLFPACLSLAGMMVAGHAEASIDQTLNDLAAPVAKALSFLVFYKIQMMGAELPLVVLWLITASVFFTFYFNFLNVRGFRHAISIVRGDHSTKGQTGEISHFQALATAVSGTVGIGNIGGVAIAISVGGPGAAFWMVIAGILGMSTKFIECTLGTMFRRENADGSVSGGPMYYLEYAFSRLGLMRTGKLIGSFYALGIVIGCMGIGNMFQSNQAYTQVVNVTGGFQSSWLSDKGWLFGVILALSVALVIIGGIKSIAKVTSKIVPFMALFYCVGALTILVMNHVAIPAALQMIVQGAFDSDAVAGGILGVIILGFQRAVFSNEAGIGSAPIAHSAVRTDNPITEGYVSLLEPFIDTVIISSLSALVIVTTMVFEPGFFTGLGGIEMTSHAFERNIPGSPIFIAIAGFLFAYSTMIAWAYYGLKGWTYLVGEGRNRELLFKLVYCCSVVVGCSMQLQSVLDISDALVFLICTPNILGLYMLAPLVKEKLIQYQDSLTQKSKRDILVQMEP